MMTAKQATLNVAPKSMEEAYVMLYGKIGEVRNSKYIMWIDTSMTDNSKHKTN